MSKLQLVIADKDEYYLHSFVDYLTACYTQLFQVVSFSEETYFGEYLGSDGAATDILLVGTELLGCIPEGVNGPSVFVLDGGNDALPPGLKERAVYKYQCGDRIVGQVLEMYSCSHPHSFYLPDGHKKTRVIAIYSPVGGVGKTAIAVGASIQSAWEGKAVFYLNLEEIPSTDLFFAGEHGGNLSGVLYYLKHRVKDPAVLVETCRTIDPRYKIHFFKPPDSALDLKEEVADELRALIRILCESKQYDRVFIDMSASLDQNNLAVLEECDDILVICGPCPASVLKINGLIHELESLRRGKNLCLLDKTSLILNCCEDAAIPDHENNDIYGKEIILKIPRVANLMVACGPKYRPDLNSEFGAVLHQLTARF